MKFTQVALVSVLAALISATPLDKRSITCVKVGATATASWTNAAGQKCTFSGVVGSNYGTNTAGGEYVILFPVVKHPRGSKVPPVGHIE